MDARYKTLYEHMFPRMFLVVTTDKNNIFPDFSWIRTISLEEDYADKLVQ